MKGNYLKIFICALIAAGILCLIAGIIIFFAVSGTDGIIVGIAFVIAGAGDIIISLLILIIVIVNVKLKSQDKNAPTRDKKD